MPRLFSLTHAGRQWAGEAAPSGRVLGWALVVRQLGGGQELSGRTVTAAWIPPELVLAAWAAEDQDEDAIRAALASEPASG